MSRKFASVAIVRTLLCGVTVLLPSGFGAGHGGGGLPRVGGGTAGQRFAVTNPGIAVPGIHHSFVNRSHPNPDRRYGNVRFRYGRYYPSGPGLGFGNPYTYEYPYSAITAYDSGYPYDRAGISIASDAYAPPPAPSPVPAPSSCYQYTYDSNGTPIRSPCQLSEPQTKPQCPEQQ